MTKKDKVSNDVKVSVKKEILNELIQLKHVGDSYSDIIEKILKFYKEKNEKN